MVAESRGAASALTKKIAASGCHGKWRSNVSRDIGRALRFPLETFQHSLHSMTSGADHEHPKPKHHMSMTMTRTSTTSPSPSRIGAIVKLSPPFSARFSCRMKSTSTGMTLLSKSWFRCILKSAHEWQPCIPRVFVTFAMYLGYRTFASPACGAG